MKQLEVILFAGEANGIIVVKFLRSLILSIFCGKQQTILAG